VDKQETNLTSPTYTVEENPNLISEGAPGRLERKSMPDLSNCVVFFDIGDTLASVRIGQNHSIELTPFPNVIDVLKNLRTHGAAWIASTR
jgi:hypothetical protein